MEKKIPDNLVCYIVTIGSNAPYYYTSYVKMTKLRLDNYAEFHYIKSEHNLSNAWLMNDRYYHKQGEPLEAKFIIEEKTKGFHPHTIVKTTFDRLPNKVQELFRLFEKQNLNPDIVEWYTPKLTVSKEQTT